MAVSSSPQCRITWTDAVQENQHYSFAMESPLELRFGLQVNPNFWELFSDDVIFIWWTVMRNGTRSALFQQGLTTNELPGVGHTELWLGIALGEAGQATENRVGIYQFRPQIWFQRNFPSAPSKFAVAPADHSFAMGFGGESLFGGSERLVGGPGTPPGSPPPG